MGCAAGGGLYDLCMFEFRLCVGSVFGAGCYVVGICRRRHTYGSHYGAYVDKNIEGEEKWVQGEEEIAVRS